MELLSIGILCNDCCQAFVALCIIITRGTVHISLKSKQISINDRNLEFLHLRQGIGSVKRESLKLCSIDLVHKEKDHRQT